MPLSLQQIGAVSGALGEIGVSREDIFRLLDACDQDGELVLCTVDLELPPREGDRVRAKLATGERSMRVEAWAMSERFTHEMKRRRYAIVGQPVEAGPGDDLVIEKVRRA